MEPSCIFLIIICVLYTLRQAGVEAIKGGTVTTIPDLPCVCNLRFNDKYFCGASFLGGTKLLTAAHCCSFDGFDTNNVTVHCGNAFLDQQGVKRTITKVILAPGYDPNTLANDTAIIYVNQAMPTVTPCTLNAQTLNPGDPVIACGWGMTGENTGPSNQLRKVGALMISKAECNADYAGRVQLPASVNCIEAPNVGSCTGDDGAPVLLADRKTIHAVYSWSFGCVQADSPRVCSSVPRAIDWIKSN